MPRRRDATRPGRPISKANGFRETTGKEVHHAELLRFKQLPREFVLPGDLPAVLTIYYKNLSGDNLGSYMLISSKNISGRWICWVAFTTFTGNASVLSVLTYRQRAYRRLPKWLKLKPERENRIGSGPLDDR
jgi:hypothetical protein